MTGGWRILQVIDKTPGQGGVPIHVAELSAELRQRGHVVGVLRLGPDATADDLASERLPFSYGLLPGLAQTGRLAAVLTRNRPQIIHLQGCYTTLSPLLIAQMRRYAPVIGTLHDIRPFCYLMTRRYGPADEVCGRRNGIGCFTSGCVRPEGAVDALRLARRWAMDGAALAAWGRLDKLLVPSGYLRDLAVGHGIAPSILRLVPNGTALPAPPDAAAAEPRPPTLLYVGGLLEYKGVGVLLEALSQLGDRPWNAVLAGDGPLRASLEAELSSRGLRQRVALLGQVTDRRRLAGLFASARLLVLPSIIPESFGLVGIEAMATGTPVIGFGLGGQGEWLRDRENGLLAAERDPADLARQIARLLDQPELARALGQRGRELVAERFQLRHMVEAVLDVYAEVLDARDPAL